jgi:hypothetical protein
MIIARRRKYRGAEAPRGINPALHDLEINIWPGLRARTDRDLVGILHADLERGIAVT